MQVGNVLIYIFVFTLSLRLLKSLPGTHFYVCVTSCSKLLFCSTKLYNYVSCMFRICHCEGGPELPLITPCYCSGSLRYVHQNCLQQWIKSSNIRCCELCKFQFIMQTKVKPFNEVIKSKAITSFRISYFVG